MHLKLLRKLQTSEIPEKVLDVCKLLSANGHQALIVGGAVRDLLLDRPVTDWDVATCATPDIVMSIFRRTVPTGLQHGTVTVMQGDEGIEVTTFRKEMGHQDGRHPDTVEFLTDFREDLARRDFTINAMAFNPLTGDLFDHHNGLDDLQARRIVTVGDANARFTEDGLRVLRAIRFSAQLNFTIEERTRMSIFPHRKSLQKVSRERIRAELNKILASPFPAIGLQHILDCGLWTDVFLGCESVTVGTIQRAIEQSVRLMPEVRLAGLLRQMHPFLGKRHLWSNLLNGFIPSREEKKLFTSLVQGEVDELDKFTRRPHIRQLSAHLGKDVVPVAVQLLEWSADRRRLFSSMLEGMPWSCKELEVSAKDLIQEGIATPGIELGILLEKLFQWVLGDLDRNDKARLLERARTGG